MVATGLREKNHRSEGAVSMKETQSVCLKNSFWQTFNDFHFSSPTITNDNTAKMNISAALPVVISWLRHHLCCFIFSKVILFSGFGTRIFLMKLNVNVSSLLHGVIVYLLSFQERNSLHPSDGWSHGSSLKNKGISLLESFILSFCCLIFHSKMMPI